MIRTPGIMTCLSGRHLDLNNLQPDDIRIEDIAWGLGRTLRFGGHIREDYSVAHHCIVMSYYVPEEFALEALLHDAAESYLGDIIWPVKSLFPQISEFEDTIVLKIMNRFGVDVAHTEGDFIDEPTYIKSEPIAKADLKLVDHESFSFGRDGQFHTDVESAWLKAAMEHETWWFAPTYAYLERFDQLTGSKTLDLDALTELWFPNDEHSEKVVKEAERAVQEMGSLLPEKVSEKDIPVLDEEQADGD